LGKGKLTRKQIPKCKEFSLPKISAWQNDVKRGSGWSLLSLGDLPGLYGEGPYGLDWVPQESLPLAF
jgi:hypothetical protein